MSLELAVAAPEVETALPPAPAPKKPTPRPKNRRGRGEGTIRKRKDEDRWEGMVSLGNGKRKSFYGKSRDDVQRMVREAIRQMEHGLPVVDERLTVAEYLRNWLATLPAATNLKPDSILRHQEFVELQIIPLIGHLRLGRLSPTQVQSLYVRCINELGLSSTTVNHLHSTLHKALEAAVRLDLIPRNVTDLVDVPRIQRTEMRVLSRAEARALLDYLEASQHADRVLYRLALATGMREGELLGLRWRDVDFEVGQLSVQSILKRTSTGNHAQHAQKVKPTTTKQQRTWYIGTPKTKRSRRLIRIGASVVDALRDHRATQHAMRQHAGVHWQDHEFVFTNAVGEPIWGSSTRRFFQRALVEAGLPRVRFHDMRHTCATLLLRDKVNPKIVSEMLGHSSVAVTLDIYSHVLPDMQQDAVAAMEGVLSRDE